MIVESLLSLRPGAQWVLRGDTHASLEWVDTNQTKPTEAEVAAEIVRLTAQAEADKYKAKRAAEYPPIGEQLDALFHAGVFPAAMAEQIQAIKDKYPKA